MEELERRIRDEYEMFYLDTIRTSKDNLFSHAEEIAIKRAITTTIGTWGRVLTDRQLNSLAAENNILDVLYRRISDSVCGEYARQIGAAVNML